MEVQVKTLPEFDRNAKRLAIASKGSGKSGGARVITFSIKVSEPDFYEVTLMTIYDKSEISNVSNAYIESLIKEL